MAHWATDHFHAPDVSPLVSSEQRPSDLLGELPSIVDRSATTLSQEDLLIARAQAGDHDAFVELFTTYSKRIARTIRGILKCHEDGEDALQDTCLKAFLHIGSFKGDSKFSTWLTRIAINTSLMTIRKQRFHREMPIQSQSLWEDGLPLEIEDPNVDVGKQHETERLVELLWIEIGRLSNTMRDTISIYCERDCSHKELASLTNVTLPAVKSRLLRARLHLGHAFSQQGYTGERRNVPEFPKR